MLSPNSWVVIRAHLHCRIVCSLKGVQAQKEKSSWCNTPASSSQVDRSLQRSL